MVQSERAHQGSVYCRLSIYVPIFQFLFYLVVYRFSFAFNLYGLFVRPLLLVPRLLLFAKLYLPLCFVRASKAMCGAGLKFRGVWYLCDAKPR